jgi:prolyl oligopeptidase
MLRLFVFGLVLSGVVPVRAQTGPVARRADTDETYHGTRVADPYRWLEALGSAETQAWARAQDSTTRAWLAGPERDALRARIASLTAARAISPPVERGGYFFNTRFGTTGGAPALTLLVRRGSSGPAREIRLSGDAGSPVRRLAPARRAPIAAFFLSNGGGGWQTWGFVDIARGQLLPDTLRQVHLASSATWADGDRVLYYTRFRVPPRDSAATALLSIAGVYRHVLGTSQTTDSLVYRPPHPSCVITLHSSANGRHVVMQESCDGTTNTLLGLGPRGTVRLTPTSQAVYRFAGSVDGDTYWQTDADAPNHKVVRLRLAGSAPTWTTIVPEDTLPLFSWSGSPLGSNLIGRTLVLAYQKDALAFIRTYDLNGRWLRDVATPTIGSIWSGFVGSSESNDAYYSVSGLASPGTIYRLDVTTGRSTVWARPEIELPLDSIVTTQVFVRSKDGTRFPMFVVRRADTPLDGTAPAWIYGYGFGDWTASPYYQPYVAEFVNRGGVWALPNIRGGGEYGEAWNQAGSRVNKQNTVDDYIAASEYLITARYSAPRRIVANASSAGGIVAAAAVLQRPELYGAAVLDFPALDMLRYHLFTVAGTWKAEYGTVEDSAQFRVLRALSAPHNVRDGVCYPPILVSAAENDETTPPFHAYKFIAALQHAKGCTTHPALLRLAGGSGHGFGRNTEEIIDNWADELTFVTRVLKPTRRISLGRLPEVVKRGRGPQQAILIPCASCRWRSFEPFIARHEETFTMYAVTLPGEGGSRHPELPLDSDSTPWRDNAVEALSNLIDRENLRDVIVIGHSFGGQMAVQLANRRADRVAGVVNLDGGLTSPTSWGRLDRAARFELARGALLQYGENVLFDPDQWQGFNQTRMPDAERSKLYHGWFMATPPDIVMQYWREGIIRDVNRELRALRVPLLDVKAISPAVVNADSARRAYAARMDSVGLPSAYRREFLDRARHFFIEEASPADAIVRDFARTIAGRDRATVSIPEPARSSTVRPRSPPAPPRA